MAMGKAGSNVDRWVVDRIERLREPSGLLEVNRNCAMPPIHVSQQKVPNRDEQLPLFLGH